MKAEQDPLLTRSHLYAKDLTATARALRSKADDAAWNFDFDVEADLIARAIRLEDEAEALIERPDEVYPLF